MHANRENFNTEIGLPLTVLEANVGVRVLVLEMAMRGMGQIRELAQIARPDVGVITNIGPVHLELVGTVERVAEAKAELIAELRAEQRRASCRRPRRRCGRTCARTCGYDHVRVASAVAGSRPSPARPPTCARSRSRARRRPCAVEVAVGRRRGQLEFNFSQAHNVTNALAAIGAAHALGIDLEALAEGARTGAFLRACAARSCSCPDGVLIVNDCYNANPVSMRAAIDHLAARADRRGARAHGRGARRHARAGPGGGASSIARSARTPPTPGVALLVAVGEHAERLRASATAGTCAERADADEAASARARS